MEIKFSKKYMISLFITVFGLIALISGTSYAILRGSTSSSNVHIVKAGSVELEVNEKYDAMEAGFSIMKDTQGLQQETVYEFTITNIGSVPAKYDLKLLNQAPSGQTALDDSYIRIGLEVNGQEMGPMGLSNVNNVIDSNTINNEEVIRYKMRVWLDKTKATQIQENSTKKAYLSLKVEAKQSAYNPKVNHYVYRYGTDTTHMYNPLAVGTYNGYCYIDNTDSSNPYSSCDDGWGFISQESCNTYITNQGMQNTTCEAGSWTAAGTTYTENATTLNKQFYLKYNIGTQTEALESYVCYILNNTEYCLKGGDGVYDETIDNLVSPSYESNKQILNDSFGASNCTDNTTYYSCSSGSLYAIAYSRGYVNASADGSYCRVGGDGDSDCDGGSGK